MFTPGKREHRPVSTAYVSTGALPALPDLPDLPDLPALLYSNIKLDKPAAHAVQAAEPLTIL